VQVSFRRFLDSGDLSDVTLCGDDGHRIRAHRIVLCAQSETFDIMLRRGQFAEAGAAEVHLPGVTRPALQRMLQFMYTGECDFAADEAALALEVLRVGRSRFAGSTGIGCVH